MTATAPTATIATPSTANDSTLPARTTHYDVLGVSPTATLEEIKMAHRSLVLSLHPDKKMTGTDRHGFDDDDDDKDEEDLFQRVQIAWECLRDPKLKREYDDDLFHQSQQERNRRRGAIPIDAASEMEECLDEEDENQTGLAYPCRCGEFVVLWQSTEKQQQKQKQQRKQTMKEHNGGEIATNDIDDLLLECPSCSLLYCVVLH